MSAGPRIARLEPGDLGQSQRELYDQIAGGKRASGPQHFELSDERGRLNGPFNALLHIPAVGEAISRLGEAIRYRTQLTDRCRETAILVVAVQHRDEFEWYAHAPIARHVGLTDDQVDDLLRNADPVFDDAAERAAHQLAVAAARGEGVDDPVWLDAVDKIGIHGAIEITAVVGYYTLLASMMKAHDIRLPAGAPAAFEDGVD